jgi:hypothetical protein
LSGSDKHFRGAKTGELAILALFILGFLTIHMMRDHAEKLTIALSLTAGVLVLSVLLTLDSRTDIGASTADMSPEIAAVGVGSR